MHDAPEDTEATIGEINVTTEATAPPYGAFLRGSFALYETPQGGMHLAWRADDEQETHHVEVPAFAVNLAQAQMAGKGGGLMGKLMGKIGGAR